MGSSFRRNDEEESLWMLLDLMRAVALTSDYVESPPDASGVLTLSSFRGRMGEGISPVFPAKAGIHSASKFRCPTNMVV